MTIIVIIKMHKKKIVIIINPIIIIFIFNAFKFKVLNTDILGNTVH